MCFPPVSATVLQRTLYQLMPGRIGVVIRWFAPEGTSLESSFRSHHHAFAIRDGGEATG
jgi:hypothetical protein